MSDQMAILKGMPNFSKPLTIWYAHSRKVSKSGTDMFISCEMEAQPAHLSTVTDVRCFCRLHDALRDADHLIRLRAAHFPLAHISVQSKDL